MPDPVPPVRSAAVLGAGYVGSALAAALRERGWRVAALTRNARTAAALRDLGCEPVIEADLAAATWHDALPGAWEFVANCVGSGGGGAAGYRHSYVEGMRSLGRWLAGRPAGTVAYTSSTGVYPQGGGARVDESAPAEPASETGRFLREAEDILIAAAQAEGWRWFVLRLAGIYGPGRHHVLDQLQARRPLAGDPAHRLNLIHRDDIVGALLACADAAPAVRDRIYNLADGAPPTRAELAGWLAEQLGLPPPSFAPSAARGGPSPFGRAPVPDRMIVADRIRAELGWRPRHADFRSGYRELFGR